MSSCDGEKIMLFYEFKRKQPKGKEDSWYHDMYAKYYYKAIKKCREKARKAKRE